MLVLITVPKSNSLLWLHSMERVLPVTWLDKDTENVSGLQPFIVHYESSVFIWELYIKLQVAILKVVCKKLDILDLNKIVKYVRVYYSILKNVLRWFPKSTLHGWLSERTYIHLDSKIMTLNVCRLEREVGISLDNQNLQIIKTLWVLRNLFELIPLAANKHWENQKTKKGQEREWKKIERTVVISIANIYWIFTLRQCCTKHVHVLSYLIHSITINTKYHFLILMTRTLNREVK